MKHEHEDEHTAHDAPPAALPDEALTEIDGRIVTLVSVGMLLDAIAVVLAPDAPLAVQIRDVQVLHRRVLDELIAERALLTTPTTTTH